jgi:hypothetical protein
MEDLVAGNLKVTVVAQGESVKVCLLGESDGRAMGEALGPYLKRLAGSCRAKTVQIDFAKLDYMNSSTLTPIVQFLQLLSDTALRVTVRYRSDLQWQATSFRAMRIVGRNWKNTEILGD